MTSAALDLASSASPIPTPRELVERAAALRSRLRDEQDENAARGTYSPELHQIFLEAGFYHISAPRMFGGYGYDLSVFFRVMLEISIGDPSVGWCLTLGASHAWFVASHWPEQAQREFFKDGVFIAPHRATPAGKLKRVPGGYELSGVWDYSSGIPYSTHFIGNAMLAEDGEAPRAMCCVLRKDQVTVLDDWGGDRTVGMLSSGSNSVRIDGAFVPEHHVIQTAAYFMRASDMVNGTPGTRLHGDPMYLGRVAGPYHAAIATHAVGAARATIDEFEHMITTRKTMHPPIMMRCENIDFQRALGNALMLTDAAEAVLVRSVQLYGEYCRRWQDEGILISEEDNLRLWGVTQQAGRLAFEAVDLLFQSAMTSSSTKRGSRVLRYYGDVMMYRAHPASGPDMLASPIGRAHLGMPIGFMTL
jgi:3-hydroxy-9,10-secoandrosta-1,3,5(10)-triene-9,17-dione monooxygenase